MDGSQLTKRVTFQTATVAAGEGVTTWADSFTVWAAVKPLVGSQRFQAAQANSQVQGKVVIRYRSDVTASMRMLYDSRYLTILSIVDPNEAHQWLEIDYKEAED